MDFPEHLQLLIGDRGHESTLPAYLESPTWIVDNAWDEFQTVARNALNAYMHFCQKNRHDRETPPQIRKSTEYFP